MKIHLLGEETIIEIEVIGRSHPKCTDYWDGNWIISNIRIEVPGYRAQFKADLRTDELRNFGNELKLMDKKLKGKASLINLDGYLEIECEINKQGTIHWTSETCYPAGIGAVLKFDFSSDQSYLKGIVQEIESILSIFPVFGKP
ncbi:hypothetical protein [Neobacillus sp. PS3-40]|uniref:WapI family immunity protein n=1 Tax=Neobacillus sp. PS3-40 TaxID=3070679 RepID=UPI0027DFDD88|nr:hypothetical protein [Neobacillus sp. PS3-40]WML46140.1 hypothetical protein RCG20_09720 [Neobacillus sp. PS3-40]